MRGRIATKLDTVPDAIDTRMDTRTDGLRWPRFDDLPQALRLLPFLDPPRFALCLTYF